MILFQNFRPYWLLSSATLVMALALQVWKGGETWGVFFNLPPWLVVLVAAGLGALALEVLTKPLRFQILRPQRLRKGLMVAFLASLVFGLIIVVADRLFPFAEDINVPLPEALIFYPVAGFVVECLFHLVPLALVLMLLRRLRGHGEGTVAMTLAIFAVATLEPTFQVLLPSSGPATGPPESFVFLHILAINLTGLSLFARYDFMTMFAFRMFYYLQWHILWGHFRLL